MDTEAMWHGIAVVCVIVLLAILSAFLFSEKPVQKYYMGERGQIMADIDWAPDAYVGGQGLGAWEQYKLMDSLNTELARHPYVKK